MAARVPERHAQQFYASSDLLPAQIQTLSVAFAKADIVDDEEAVEAIAEEMLPLHLGALTFLQPILDYVRQGPASPVHRSRVLAALGMLPMKGAVLNDLLVEVIGFCSSASAAIRYGAATCLRLVVEQGGVLESRHQRYLAIALQQLQADEVPAIRTAAVNVLNS